MFRFLYLVGAEELSMNIICKMEYVVSKLVSDVEKSKMCISITLYGDGITPHVVQ